VTLTATPDPGSSLLGWSADCDSSTQTATVGVYRDLTCEVQFGIAGTPQLHIEPAIVAFAPTKTRSKRTITLFNQGNGGLRLAELTILDPLAFQINEDNCSHAMLIPDGSCTVTLVFEPPAEETYQTQLHISSNDPNTPTLVELQGSSCSQQNYYRSNVVFHPYRLDFGIEAVGHLTTRQQRVDMWSQGCG
jgi:hypothetical protein